MGCRSKKFLLLLLMLVLVIGLLPVSAWAVEDITCNIEKEGTNVSITGNAFPNSFVSLMVTRSIDSSKSYLDQTKSDENGDYSFSFALDGGDYETIVSCNGLYKQCDLTIKSSATKTVTVRVEGETETKLPQTEISILAGETTLFEAITGALDSANVEYKINNGLIDTVAGEEGWQWLVNNQFGMYLPSTPLNGGDEIVLIDDFLFNPIITKLSVSTDKVKVGEVFTVILQEVEGTSVFPAAKQPVTFDGVEKTTDAEGKVTFTAQNKGTFVVVSEPTGGLIRPVPLPVVVEHESSGGPGGGTTPGNSISIDMRIEGYKGTIFDGSVSFNPNDYKDDDGKYRITDSDGVKHEFDAPTVLLATIVAWNENNIRDNSIGYDDNYVARMAGEEEFDFRDEHSTCGWMIRVNDSMINQGVGVWQIKDGDKVEWYYTALDAYFGYLDVAPTSLKTGEKIKVKVTGRSNRDSDIGGYGNKSAIEGADVYVGDNAYKTGKNGEVEVAMNNRGTFEVYAIKLDQNSQCNGYYFPLLSRTEKVQVTVTVTASGGGIGPSIDEAVIEAAVPVVVNYKDFTDLQSYEWAEEAIKGLTEKGIIFGRSPTQFDPSASVTRAEFAAMAARMLKYEVADVIQLPFKDVGKDSWYNSVVAAIYANGLMNGKSENEFDPDGKITRQEMAVVIANILKKKSYKPADEAELKTFSDSLSIAEWAKDSVALAAREGIIKGMLDGKFDPGENTNRAQAAVVLYRLYKLFME